jgi:hypothetical protein
LLKYHLTVVAFFPEIICELQLLLTLAIPAWYQLFLHHRKITVQEISFSSKYIAHLFQIDFANAFIGGGVLGHGCVQEEIRFLISPELIVSRLFTERLSDNECLIMTGFERFSDYAGYASTFRFTGNHVDQTPVDPASLHRRTRLVAIDALYFRSETAQFTKDNIVRELNKAFVGFDSSE